MYIKNTRETIMELLFEHCKNCKENYKDCDEREECKYQNAVDITITALHQLKEFNKQFK